MKPKKRVPYSQTITPSVYILFTKLHKHSQWEPKYVFSSLSEAESWAEANMRDKRDFQGWKVRLAESKGVLGLILKDAKESGADMVDFY